MFIRTLEIMEKIDKLSANNYYPLPVVITKGEGIWLWDVEGKKYLDMFGAYSAQNFGQCHPRIIEAAVNQVRRLGTTSRAVYVDVYEQFVQSVFNLCGMKGILPASGGAEAVETAIKVSRKWGNKVKKIKSPEIIFATSNFHGRTVTITSASDNLQNRDGFGPFTPGLQIIPFGDPDELGRSINKNTAAFLVEPIQGEGGIIIPPDGYLREVRRICDKYNVLLVLDEIQTGLGRTGYNLAYQYEDIQPDVLILGKALGGGVAPVSVTLGRPDVMGVLNPGDHGSTFGGNPLACALAVASLTVLTEERLSERARDLGNYFMAELRKIKSPFIIDIRGRGLMIGIELRGGKRIGRSFCEAMLAARILCKDTRENVIRIAPPLIVTREQIDLAVTTIKGVLLNWSKRSCS